MIYSKTVKDILLLEAELKKMKAIYTNALKHYYASAYLNELRRQIKALSGRINILMSEPKG